MAQFFVEIPISDDWPTPEELAARNLIIQELDGHFGISTGAGAGMGHMDFSYRMFNQDTARESLERLCKSTCLIANTAFEFRNKT